MELIPGICRLWERPLYITFVFLIACQRQHIFYDCVTHKRCQRLFRSKLRLQEVFKRSFRKRGIATLRSEIQIDVEILNVFSGSDKTVLREKDIFWIVLTRKIFYGRLKKQLIGGGGEKKVFSVKYSTLERLGNSSLTKQNTEGSVNIYFVTRVYWIQVYWFAPGNSSDSWNCLYKVIEQIWKS